MYHRGESDRRWRNECVIASLIGDETERPSLKVILQVGKASHLREERGRIKRNGYQVKEGVQWLTF